MDRVFEPGQYSRKWELVPMRCYIPIKEYRADLPPFPKGTRAYSDPAAALRAAWEAGAAVILMWYAEVHRGRTVKELHPGRFAHAYRTKYTRLQDDATGYRLKNTRPSLPAAPRTHPQPEERAEQRPRPAPAPTTKGHPGEAPGATASGAKQAGSAAGAREPEHNLTGRRSPAEPEGEPIRRTARRPHR